MSIDIVSPARTCARSSARYMTSSARPSDGAVERARPSFAAVAGTLRLVQPRRLAPFAGIRHTSYDDFVIILTPGRLSRRSPWPRSMARCASRPTPHGNHARRTGDRDRRAAYPASRRRPDQLLRPPMTELRHVRHRHDRRETRLHSPAGVDRPPARACKRLRAPAVPVPCLPASSRSCWRSPDGARRSMKMPWPKIPRAATAPSS